jgi:hypothetical protein
MREIRTSGSMSVSWKRSRVRPPQAALLSYRATARLYSPLRKGRGFSPAVKRAISALLEGNLVLVRPFGGVETSPFHCNPEVGEKIRLDLFRCPSYVASAAGQDAWVCPAINWT